jgi:hypothetical protein
MRRTGKLAATAVVWLLVGWPALAFSATRVVFTVDVESTEHFNLPDQMSPVCEGGSACGVMEIVRLLQARHWSGTFFLDVYEHQIWGKPAMQKIAVELRDAGQDVALHTHPQWVYDPARWAMHQYSLDEQTTIVRDGVRLLEEWTGQRVVSHRAGAYTADERTLIALQRNGVPIDSSLFWQYPHNRLGPLGLPHNQPSQYGGVFEIPVTAYLREDRPNIFSGALAPVSAIRKIDPNWFVDAGEVKSAIDGALSANVPVLVVFLHSFSFMTAPTRAGVPVADRHAIEMFRVIVDQIASHRLPVVTMRELAEDMPAVPSTEADVVPRVTVSIDVPHYAWHRLKGLGRRSIAIGVALAVLCATGLLGLLVLARRRKASHRTASLSRATDGPAALSGAKLQ